MPAVTATDSWWRSYVRRVMATATNYQIELLGVIEGDRVLRKETAECLDREREAGRIR